jgi:monoamine oxidase
MAEPRNIDCDVIVIGGGLAGSTAARDLNEAGHSVILVEARDRLGGRTWYRKLAHADRTAEVGGTWILTRHYHAVMREVERYNLPLVDSPDATETYWRMGDKTWPGAFPLPYDQWYDLEQALLTIIKDARRTDHTRPLSEQNVEDLDVSWKEYVDKLDLPFETRQVLDAYPLLNAGADSHEFSALWVMNYLSGLKFSALAFAQYYVKFAHGTKSLIDALTDGIDVRLSSPATSVNQDDTSVTVTLADGSQLTGRTAILATPVNTWTDVTFEPQLSKVKLKWATHRQPGHSFKTWVLAEHSEAKPMMINVYDPVIQMAFPEYETPQGDLFACFGIWHGEDIADPQVMQDSLDRVGGPKVEVIGVDFHDWNADPYSKGTWNPFPVGWLSKDQSEMKRQEGRLAFAGADISLSNGGLLEGAVLSGGVAAAEIIEFLGTQ